MSAKFGSIILLAILLLVATFAVGIIPLYWLGHNSNKNSDKYIYMLSQFGIGMLLGTSFMLVIPEGIKACVEHDGNVGLNLLVGFIGVYLLDRIVQLIMKRGTLDSRFEEASRINSLKDLIRYPKVPFLCILRNNVVFALFIHGLSDGIALGTTTGNGALLFVLLIAIVIHKIPATLSLSSLMISKQKLPKWEILSNLFAFALSTPLGYVVVSCFNLSDSSTMEVICGNLLLMSGGSLLYASFTAFVGGDEHDHSQISSNENAVQYDKVESQSTNSRNATPIPPIDLNFEDTDGNHETIQSSSNNNSKLLKYDESVYILIGVIIPLIISFVISED
ncbi:hypothetical protein TBLA_0A09180 [Henningerozyma blattae CBS 6284]|uniref:Zinc/iron permease n=1 Tax=Henningerozyma blattae (strain ATCC 34711 / CBS 6284 / DSM 70876 / NBRC 10599 / NRRL Y-10934 / UCD 77-7) TaxID=1071380 RepID=I2GX54_HENB6|nr:hypothetical protein TBLA_0A09180 [Tetrapisispora blattae CBS 6284]CCH58706.1 hypothetical protein TBLA_0A09180 [Tetrapisispora blattae CBS 6284]